MTLLFWASSINCSALGNTDQHWPASFITDSHWPTLINAHQHQHWTTLADIDQQWSTWINTGQHWWTLINTVDIDQHWSILSNTDQHWPTLIITGEHWLNTASYPIQFHHIPSSLLCVHQMFRNPHTGFWKLRNLLGPSYPPVLQSSNHPDILVWDGGMRVAIEFNNSIQFN